MLNLLNICSVQKEEDAFRQVRLGKRPVAELKSMLEVLGLERSGKQVR